MFGLLLTVLGLLAGNINAQAQTLMPATVMPSVSSGSSCSGGASIYGDDAVDLAKTITANEDKQTKGDVIIVKKEVKTTGGATLACEIFSDKMSGKNVQNFEGRKSTCTLTPNASPSASVSAPGMPSRATGGNRIRVQPSYTAPARQ